jgi:hypothetical protein
VHWREPGAARRDEVDSSGAEPKPFCAMLVDALTNVRALQALTKVK